MAAAGAVVLDGFGRRRQLNNAPAPAAGGGGQHDPGDGRHRRRHGNVVPRRLRACAATYMMLGAAFLLRAVVVVGEAERDLLAHAGHVAAVAHAAVGFLLWLVGTALLLLSFLDRRFPAAATAAARLAHAALQRLL